MGPDMSGNTPASVPVVVTIEVDRLRECICG